MSKSKRLLELLLYMNQKKRFTTKELALEFNVSQRTILRDLQELCEIGIPLYSETGAAGGYEIINKKNIPSIHFSENEIMTIFLSLQMLSYYQDFPLKNHSISVEKKFYNSLSDETKKYINKIKEMITLWIPNKLIKTPLLDEIFLISQENCFIEFLYSKTDETKIYKIFPIELHSINGLWYWIGYEYKTKKNKIFRVDYVLSILSTTKTKKPKNIPKSIHEFLIQFENISPKEDEIYKFQAKLDSIGVQNCQIEFKISKGLIIYPDGTGEVSLYVPHSNIEWLASFCLSNHIHMEVKKPEILIMRIKYLIKQLQKQYAIEDE